MLASPSIQEIASALARTSSAPRPDVRTPSRILCLRLQELPSAGFERTGRAASLRAIAEAFLKFSPRVSYRTSTATSGSAKTKGVAVSETHWLFLDIASTSHLFALKKSREDIHASRSSRDQWSPEHDDSKENHGEERLMAAAASLARDLGFGVQCAIADTPSGAQAFASSHPSDTVIPPGEERDRLKQLSLPHLLSLEGLEPWARPTVVESIVTFFMMLGFKTADDLSRFTLASLQERWGDTGALLWKRLNAQDRAVVSPLIPTEPLEDYVHLDFPVSLVSLLLHQMEKSVDFLFARLQGRRYFASKLILTLHCEYSKEQHKIVIEPNTPSRDRDLFLQLLESRLGDVGLENPIRDFEVHVMPVAEKTRQLDFFEPRNTDSDKLTGLMSLLTQSSLKPGLYRIEPSIVPERGWQLVSSPEERDERHQVALEPDFLAVAEHHKDYVGDGRAVRPEPYYGSAVMSAPRPTRILHEPMPLSLEELGRMKILSNNPIERLENGWWEKSETRRDYYFAISHDGECLWIFQDLRTEEYFLHGYFD
jgi:protein ImuB